MSLLCCIFFLFSTILNAEEIPSNENGIKSDTKAESNGSRVGIYIVNGTSVANVNQLKGAKEVKYVKAKKKDSEKIKKQKDKRSEVRPSVAVEKKTPSKTQDKVVPTKFSPIKKENSLISSSRQIVAAISVAGKIFNKYKKIAEIQPAYQHFIPELKGQVFNNISTFSFQKEQHFFLTCWMRPPPVC